MGSYGKCRLYGYAGNDGRPAYLAVTKHFKNRDALQAVNVPMKSGSFRISLSTNNASILSFHRAVVEKPVGHAIYLTGIVGLTPPEKKLVDTFNQWGWHVIVSHTSHHFMKPRMLVHDEKTIETEARKLAHDANNHLADKAYAIEAMVLYLKKHHPQLLKGKRIIAGGSAGALALPVTAARLGRFDAAVLIGGGGNIGTILTESSLNPLSLYEVHQERSQKIWKRAEPEVRQKVAKLIHRDIPLDPARLAGRLGRTPVLMMQAEMDQMVPVSTGNLLATKFANMERWGYPVNHIVLFGALHFQASTVAQWVHAKVFPQPEK